jgi:hypothetical protein
LLKYFSSAQDSNFWNIAAKFIFVSTHHDKNRLAQISSFLLTVRALNSIIAGSDGGKLVIYAFNTFEKEALKRFYKIDLNTTAVGEFFPDKLRDLKGYKYRTITYSFYPTVFYNHNKYQGMGINFIEAVAKHQNASYTNIFIMSMKAREKEFKAAFNNLKVDLSVNTGMKLDTKRPDLLKNVNTYETDGFCAMLPYPHRRSFFNYVMKPYDSWTWILIAATVMCFMVVWNFLNKHTPVTNPNSAWFMLFAFVTFFIGQGVEFREHRLMQKTLIQLMLLMTFILGNAYQSVLISMMAESRYGERITTVQGMIDSNFTVKVDPVFMKMLLEGSEQNRKFLDKISGEFPSVNDLNFKELSAANTGLILSCNVAGVLYHDIGKISSVDRNAIDFYYRLPEKIFSFFAQFPTAPYSPFADRLQHYSLKIHESGIKQRWMNLLLFEDMVEVKKREYNAREEYLLNLQDMLGAFYCLGIGLTAAFIAFLLEIFWYDCVDRLMWEMIAKPIRRRLRRWTWRNKVAPRRIIQVRPFDDSVV